MRDDLWCVYEDEFELAHMRHHEGMFTQGNGYMSVRGCFEEGVPSLGRDACKYGTFVPGMTGQHPILKNEIINLPWFLDMKIVFDGQALDMNISAIEEYGRWLDLRDGVLCRTFIWRTEKGQVLKLCFKRFASMDNKNMFVQKVELRVLEGYGSLTVEAGIDGSILTNGFDHLKVVKTYNYKEESIVLETSTNGSNTLWEMSRISWEDCGIWNMEQDERRIYFGGKRQLVEGDSISIMKLTCLWTDRDMERSDLESNFKVLRQGIGKGYDALYQEHLIHWKKKWDICDIEVHGDPQSQKAIRFSIYHLIRSNAEDDPRVAICAKGHAGEGYCGRYFWDTEIYLLPFFIYTNPKAAKNLLRFRYLTLGAAREIASAYGYDGARYPWEASVNGQEQCPLHSHADNQVHVTADIVYGLWHYYKVTGDMGFMVEMGIDIMVETSRYWCERVDVDNAGVCNILGVIGPDEYKPYVMNNAYTNKMVSFALEKTGEFLRALKDEDYDRYAIVAERLNIKEKEIETFESICMRIKPPFEDGYGVIQQCDGFHSYAHMDIQRLWKDKGRYFWENVSWERIFRSKALKQADVLLMLNLFPQDFTCEAKLKAYEYYEPITVHDSSLSWAVHAMLLAQLGRAGESHDYFMRAGIIDLEGKKGGASEGIHIANCGGVWQAVIYGFAGLKSGLWQKEPDFRPCLPKSWSMLKFSIVVSEQVYRITITHDGVDMEAVDIQC